MANKRYHEIDNPKQDVEYWVVVDETTEIPHYFVKEEYARQYAAKYGHDKVFRECFN